jgi:hypothetical protein
VVEAAVTKELPVKATARFFEDLGEGTEESIFLKNLGTV